ncbi:hypothetical protein, partial [Pseudomonas sp. FG-3G]
CSMTRSSQVPEAAYFLNNTPKSCSKKNHRLQFFCFLRDVSLLTTS